MPNRVIREGFLDSDKVNTLNAPEQIFFLRLMLVADDFGRFDARPKFLESKCYPMSKKRININKMLKRIHEVGLCKIYTVDGKQYLEIIDFGQRTRIMRSKYPECPQGADRPPQSAAGSGLKPNQTNPIQNQTGESADALKEVELNFIKAWDSLGKPFSKIVKFSDDRKKALRARLKDFGWKEMANEALQKMKGIPFCRGETTRGWIANVDWFLRPDTVTSILENKYGKSFK